MTLRRIETILADKNIKTYSKVEMKQLSSLSQFTIKQMNSDHFLTIETRLIKTCHKSSSTKKNVLASKLLLDFQDWRRK